MGVINLTPDSFSDGGNTIDHKNLSKFKNLNAVLDIGMESTAPKNFPISAEIEIERFKTSFLDNIDLFLQYSNTFSFDTYKISTIEFIVNSLRDYDVNIIWNDISGSLDDEMISFLKRHKNVSYIFCHNLSGKYSRNTGSKHLDFIGEELNTSHVVNFFENALSFFTQNSISHDRIHLDPCFGFSKTYEQNLELLKSIERLFEVFPRWVVGISRKSFLQKQVQNQKQSRDQIITDSESIHLSTLSDIYLKSHRNNIYFRLHDPQVFISFLQNHHF